MNGPTFAKLASGLLAAGLRLPRVRRFTSSLDEPGAARLRTAVMVGVLVVWAIVWLFALAATCLSPPFDNVEQLTWVRSLQWGYYKHPPLPTLVLWPMARLFGIHPWVTYVLGAVVTCAALALGWRLTCKVSGEPTAWLATLGTLCITYYSGRLYYYNHNVLLLLSVAATATFCWEAFSRRSLVAWSGVGLFLGLGALAKYQVAIAAISVLAFWLLQRGWRVQTHRAGLLLAAAVAGLVFLPHAFWLTTHDFQPIRYAVETSLGTDLPPGARFLTGIAWLADQVGRLSPALLLGAGLLAASRGRGAVGRAVATPGCAKTFLFCWGALPLLSIGAIGFVFGVDLQAQWGTAFVLLTCAWLISVLGSARASSMKPSAGLAGFIVVQGILLGVNWAQSPIGPALTMAHHDRNFPSQRAADLVGPAARAQLHGPIRVIAGPAALASVIALRLPERPSVLLEGRYDYSPWVSRSTAEACGVLWVVPAAPASRRAGAAPGPPEVRWLVQAPSSDGCQSTVTSAQPQF